MVATADGEVRAMCWDRVTAPESLRSGPAERLDLQHRPLARRTRGPPPVGVKATAAPATAEFLRAAVVGEARCRSGLGVRGPPRSSLLVAAPAGYGPLGMGCRGLPPVCAPRGWGMVGLPGRARGFGAFPTRAVDRPCGGDRRPASRSRCLSMPAGSPARAAMRGSVRRRVPVGRRARRGPRLRA